MGGLSKDDEKGYLNGKLQPPVAKKLKRRFLGNTSRTASTFEKKELAAYLKGQVNFSFGRHDNGDQAFHKVRQEYYH